MQISEDQLYSSLQQAVEQIWGTSYLSVEVLGKGVYGHCYGITLGSPPYRAVIKVHRYPQVGEQEQRQLIELYAHLGELVPRVYGYVPGTASGDMLIMDWLPGKSCPRPENLAYPVRKSLQHQAVDLLQKLHAIEHPPGYGAFDGPFYQRWWDYYGQRVESTYEAIMRDEQARTYLGPQVLALMERSRQCGERVLSTSTGKPVLLHGDFSFGNLLFEIDGDGNPWRISGLIDPLDAEWGDRELDLVNVVNGHVKHFELVNRYRERVELGSGFAARYWFYHVWMWLAYYVRVGVRCREWVERCGREFDRAVGTRAS